MIIANSAKGMDGEAQIVKACIKHYPAIVRTTYQHEYEQQKIYNNLMENIKDAKKFQAAYQKNVLLVADETKELLIKSINLRKERLQDKLVTLQNENRQVNSSKLIKESALGAFFWSSSVLFGFGTLYTLEQANYNSSLEWLLAAPVALTGLLFSFKKYVDSSLGVSNSLKYQNYLQEKINIQKQNKKIINNLS